MTEHTPKWTWDKFERKERPEPQDRVRDPEAIRALVSYPQAEAIEIHFFPVMDFAFVVVSGCDVVPEERISEDESTWHIRVLSTEEFSEVKRSAYEKFQAADGIPNSLIPKLISNGVFDFDDLFLAGADWLSSIGGITEKMADDIIDFADEHSEALDPDDG